MSRQYTPEELHQMSDILLSRQNATKTLLSALMPYQLELYEDPSRLKAVLGSKRCLGEGTLISTTSGNVPIENIRVGDYVLDEYGKPCSVIETHKNGEQECFALTRWNKVLAYATADHEFLTTDPDRQTIRKRR